MNFQDGVRAMTPQAFEIMLTAWAAQEARLRANGKTAEADKQAALVASFKAARGAK